MAAPTTKAQWDAITTTIFCEVCVEEVMAGNRPTNTFNKIGWKNVERKFNEKTNKTYQYKQLRNKWDALKSDWVLWNQLLKQETRLGWNHEKGTIDATPQRWAALKAENREFTKFVHNGLENTAELEIMFAKIVATSETAWSPVAGIIFPNQNVQNVGEVRVEDAIDLDEGSGDFDKVNIMATQTQRSNEKRKNTVGSSSKGKGEKVKLGGVAYMQRQVDHLCDAVESYTSPSLTESSNKNYDASTGSIGECMDMEKKC